MSAAPSRERRRLIAAILLPLFVGMVAGIIAGIYVAHTWSAWPGAVAGSWIGLGVYIAVDQVAGRWSR